MRAVASARACSLREFGTGTGVAVVRAVVARRKARLEINCMLMMVGEWLDGAGLDLMEYEDVCCWRQITWRGM